MLPRADIAGIRPVASIEPARPTAPVADTRQEAFDRFSQLFVGKQFQAEILSRLNDGSFVVKVADTALRMNLPDGAQVGDALHLTLVAAQPRPTFLLGTPTTGASADTDTALSNTGRLIDQVLQAAQKEGAPTALVGKAPLVPSPAAGAAQVATALKDTLAFSGLFYESHVGQWASGERPLSDLLREPQAKNGNPALLAAALRANPAGAGALPAPGAAHPGVGQPDANRHEPAHLSTHAGEPAQTPSSAATAALPAAGNPLPADTSNAVPSKAGDLPVELPTAAISANGSSAGSGHAARADAMNSESVKMISLQLNALEQQRVTWQGELWPGQPMEWEVTKHDTPHGQAGDAERSWQSVVRFELPTLGAVAASIRLTGGRLQVQVRAADEATASLLRTHGDELASALDAAGSPLDLLTVKRDESV